MASYWITKYALTTGIFRVDDGDVRDGYICRNSGQCSSPTYLFVKIGTDAFDNEADAKLNALKKAQAKLKSIDKERFRVLASIAQFQNPDFHVEEPCPPLS